MNSTRMETDMNNETPVIEIKNLTRRYGKLDAVNGLSLDRARRALLRLLRPQRRGQDHDHQMPAESAPAHLRHRARVRPRPAEATKSPSNRGSPTCRTWWRFIRG